MNITSLYYIRLLVRNVSHTKQLLLFSSNIYTYDKYICWLPSHFGLNNNNQEANISTRSYLYSSTGLSRITTCLNSDPYGQLDENHIFASIY